MTVAWAPAWRSGLGISFSRGVLYASGLIYAQVAEAAALSTYLLAFRAIQLVTELSQAPFNSKIPLLARLRSEGRFSEQLRVARRSMRLTYWVYAAGFVGIGLSAAAILNAIGSRVEFADARLWSLLGLGFFVERYGAMHIQLYSTTNHIIWHVANGVTGAIYLVVSLRVASAFRRLCVSYCDAGWLSRVLLLVLGGACVPNLFNCGFFASSEMSCCRRRLWSTPTRPPRSYANRRSRRISAQILRFIRCRAPTRRQQRKGKRAERRVRALQKRGKSGRSNRAFHLRSTSRQLRSVESPGPRYTRRCSAGWNHVSEPSPPATLNL